MTGDCIFPSKKPMIGSYFSNYLLSFVEIFNLDQRFLKYFSC